MGDLKNVEHVTSLGNTKSTEDVPWRQKENEHKK